MEIIYKNQQQIMKYKPTNFTKTIEELDKCSIGDIKMNMDIKITLKIEEIAQNWIRGFEAQAFCNEAKTEIIALDLKFILNHWDESIDGE